MWPSAEKNELEEIADRHNLDVVALQKHFYQRTRDPYWKVTKLREKTEESEEEEQQSK